MIQKPSTQTFLSIVLLLATSCSGTGTQVAENSQTIQQAFTGNIRTTKSVINRQEKEMTLTGKVVSDPDKTIRYVPLINGVIERTYFSSGDKVTKGQALIDIRSTELSALHAERVALASEVNIAERECRTVTDMFQDNLSSERELLEAEGRLKQAQASLFKVENDMAVFGINKGDGTFSINAPMNGYIIHKKASSGSTVSADSDPLFTIADLSSVWIIVNVYASQLKFVREGMEAVITTLSYPDERFTGTISHLSHVFDPEDKALKARIVLPNKEMKLKSEMPVVVRLKDTTQNGMVSVPSEAVIFDDNTYFVIVDKGNNTYEKKEIVPYDKAKNSTYISSGLEADEAVVIKNQLLIYSELKEQ